MRTMIPKRDASLPSSTAPSGAPVGTSPDLNKPLPPLPPETMPGRRGRQQASAPGAPATPRRPLMGGLFSRGTRTPPAPASTEGTAPNMVDEALSPARKIAEELFNAEQFDIIGGWLADRETNGEALTAAAINNGPLRRMTTALAIGSALLKGCPGALSDEQTAAAGELAAFMGRQVVKDHLGKLGDGTGFHAVDPELVMKQLPQAAQLLHALTTT